MSLEKDNTSQQGVAQIESGAHDPPLKRLEFNALSGSTGKHQVKILANNGFLLGFSAAQLMIVLILLWFISWSV